MYAREGRVESAAQDTGDWLLKRQDFQDWAQRKRLNEHHGFFWIQGNPGSGKSTLMKKAYSHIQHLSQDPSSVIAAFFFNARGSEIEKSPTGLFRTLLHALCQHISALRAIVMKVYHRNQALLNPSWEWQSYELKELLSSVVTTSILGQRNLILCVDALDECDLIGAKSVIQFFENLASSSIVEGTKFNVCLSSRYWPIFSIQHCFKTRVELENHGDIASYIQQHMKTMQAVVNDSSQLAVLEAKLKNKANGTFLWVVLVVQELLAAHENGATLGEIDGILHEVPPDLWNFYQYQMENTGHNNRHQMLWMLQCVFYSLNPLSPKELRYLLAFGHVGFSSYSEWAQSSEYVSDAQMEKRIREKSKGMIEIAELPEGYNRFKALTERRRIVQFIHQSVRDFLSRYGFGSLRRGELPNDAASGHEFMKTACFNYLNTADLKYIPEIDFRFYSDNRVRHKMPTLSEDHPLLEYAVDYLFPHAALAEGHGVQQDGLRSYMSDNIQESFERWKYLHDLVSIQRGDEKPYYIYDYSDSRGVQGPGARPLHVFAQYGLLAPGVTDLKEDPNIRGGLYKYPLLAAAAGGHIDAVRYLLNAGADVKIVGPSGETAYDWAAARGHVSLLKLLLGHPLPVLTLQERIGVARCVQERVYPLHPVQVSARKVHEILALLIPEDSIPVSAAMDQVGDLISHAGVNGPLLALILDKCEAEFLGSESLLYDCVANATVRVPLVQRLLNSVESVYICPRLLEALLFRDHENIIRGEEIDKVAEMLLALGDIEVTESFVNSLCELRNSSQLLRQLAAAGHEMPPLTCHQTMVALSNGSPESVGFFVQHAPDDASSHEMLLAAVQNETYGDQAVRVLLGLRSVDPVCKTIVNASLQNLFNALSLLKTFEDRWGTLAFSKDVVVTALSNCKLDVAKFVLSRCEHFSLTESVVITATRNKVGHAEDIVDLLLEYDSAFHVQDRLVAKTVAEPFGQNILKVYLRRGNPLVLTENVVRAAARNPYGGFDALEIIFQENRGAKVSNAMVLEALRSRRGAALITLMLESDPSITMQEDFLIAAASNSDKGALIFEALHQKGRISVCSSVIGAPRAPPAKRRRISSDSSSLLEENGVRSTQITKKVIEATAANDNEDERRRLLSLFQTWGVLSDEDRRLLDSSEEPSSRSPFSLIY